jgi:hypothetical protein
LSGPLRIREEVSQRLTIYLLILLAAIVPLSGQGKTSPLIIDLRAHRDEIRTALLRYTPPGTKAKDVVAFIGKQFSQDDDIAALKPLPAKNKTLPAAEKVIRVYLGHYYDHPELVFYSAPLLMQREVSAQWWFDREDRLIDITVDKKNGVY